MARGAKGKPRRADRHLAPQRGESGTWGSARVFESARRTWSTMVKKVELSFVSYVLYKPTLWKSAGGLSSRPGARVVPRSPPVSSQPVPRSALLPMVLKGQVLLPRPAVLLRLVPVSSQPRDALSGGD